MAKGWHRESRRHSLASKGVKTAVDKKPLAKVPLPVLEKISYDFTSDGGHGWLKVPTGLLYHLGIEKKITPYSFLRNNGDVTYLEEDVDAPLFIKAMREKENIEVDLNIKEVQGHSKIRALPSYSTQAIKRINKIHKKYGRIGISGTQVNEQ